MVIVGRELLVSLSPLILVRQETAEVEVVLAACMGTHDESDVGVVSVHVNQTGLQLTPQTVLHLVCICECPQDLQVLRGLVLGDAIFPVCGAFEERVLLAWVKEVLVWVLHAALLNIILLLIITVLL